MKYLFTLLSVLFLNASIWAQHKSMKILLIPLDDRPPCLQFTQEMGKIGNAVVIAPPMSLLGKFTTPGRSDEIITWIKKQDIRSFDAAVVSLDMLAYGGLVASRVHQIGSETALKRMEVLKAIRQAAPKLPVYAQSVIMRLAPTGDSKNEAYRAKLADWAELSVAADASTKARVAQLEQEIPAEALQNYKDSRVRNLKVNLAALDDVKTGVIDYLILSQDDAKPKGVHIADRERLIAQTKELGLSGKVLVQPGADEISMLLLARALNKKTGYVPKIKAIYSSAELRDQPMPFEDRPLHQTVSFDIEAVGAKEVNETKDADLLFYVFASRFENGRAASFTREIAAQAEQGKGMIVADVDPKGNVQGGDTGFTAALLAKDLLPKLYGYASWNTAGNTIGTALPQGVIFALAQQKLKSQPQAEKNVRHAQHWFTFHRLIDDYYYHNLVRGEAKDFIAKNSWNALRLTDEQTRKVEAFCVAQLGRYFTGLNNSYFGQMAAKANYRAEDLNFLLPWNRTFEAYINFNLKELPSKIK